MLQITTSMKTLLLSRGCHNFPMESTALCCTLFCITLCAILFKVSKLAAIYSARVSDCSCWNIFNCRDSFRFEFSSVADWTSFPLLSAGWPRLASGTTWTPSWRSKTMPRSRRRSTIGLRTTPKPKKFPSKHRWRQKVQRGESRWDINYSQSNKTPLEKFEVSWKRFFTSSWFYESRVPQKVMNFKSSLFQTKQ